MLPAFVVVAIGVDPTRALVLSQVVLSLALPVPMIALLILVFRRDVMGTFVPGKVTRAAALAGTVVVLGLNLVLLGTGGRGMMTRHADPAPGRSPATRVRSLQARGWCRANTPG